ncbi:MAG: hypothetical protein Q9219_002999 [cf. Caloplaca sp. 3 TL-2023]
MTWTFVDAPADGTSMLVWQPLAKLGTEFASDGYIWADAEQAFSSQAKGYTVEMYLHRSGYRDGESVATHQRRRYRLMPTQHPNPQGSNPDPSLWIVHYSRADSVQHVPVNRIPIAPFVKATLSQRKFLQQHGQPVRKEFMLHDRNNWPTINTPGSNSRAQPSTYPSNVISHLSRQQPAYVQPRVPPPNVQPRVPPPNVVKPRAPPPDVQSRALPPGSAPDAPRPAKRLRRKRTAEIIATPPQVTGKEQPMTVADEEDISGGDALDFLTPRDISATRYKLHHDWLGEVFRSPYDTRQIVPGELGLGRKGELESLTRAFFNAPTEISPRTIKGTSPHSTKDTAPDTTNATSPAHVGRLEDGKADEFTKMAADRMADIQAAIEKMKREHSKRMARLAKGKELQDAEKALRVLGFNSGDVRTNGGADHNNTDLGDSKVAEIRTNVESTLGRKIREIKQAECIQKGGLQEKVNENDNGSQGFSFDDQVAELNEQTPAFQTPHDQLGSMENIPGMTADRVAVPGVAHEAAGDNQDAAMVDVAMGGMQNASQVGEIEDQDIVAVNKEGEDANDGPIEGSPDLGAFANDPAMDSNAGTPGGVLEAPAGSLPDLTVTAAENAASTELVGNDFTESVDFGNLDTAGEALSGYEAGRNMEMDDSADLGLDDTAFGDAFHNDADTGHDSEGADL